MDDSEISVLDSIRFKTKISISNYERFLEPSVSAVVSIFGFAVGFGRF